MNRVFQEATKLYLYQWVRCIWTERYYYVVILSRLLKNEDIYNWRLTMIRNSLGRMKNNPRHRSTALHPHVHAPVHTCTYTYGSICRPRLPVGPRASESPVRQGGRKCRSLLNISFYSNQWNNHCVLMRPIQQQPRHPHTHTHTAHNMEIHTGVVMTPRQGKCKKSVCSSCVRSSDTKEVWVGEEEGGAAVSEAAGTDKDFKTQTLFPLESRSAGFPEETVV